MFFSLPELSLIIKYGIFFLLKMTVKIIEQSVQYLTQFLQLTKKKENKTHTCNTQVAHKTN